jgi:ParB family chromosome partitioning protein
MKVKPPMSKAAVRTIVLRKVVVPDGRKRAAWGLDELIASIREIGLINPITVTRGLVLVAGLHRLQACEAWGWKEIPVNVLSIDQLEAELAEIDENLCRLELTALERAEQTARRKQIYEARHPETRAGQAQARGANQAQGRGDVSETASPTSFTRETASKTGKTRRSVELDVQVAEGLVPEVRDAIRETPLADRTRGLVELARIADPGEQAQVANMVANGQARSVAEAKERLAAAAGGSTVVRDELGQAIPDPAIAEAFTLLRPRILQVVHHLRAGRRAWGTIAEEQEAAQRLRLVCGRNFHALRLKIERDPKELTALIALAAPHSVCPYCQGAPLAQDRAQWCQGCRGGGWLDRSDYEAVPPEMKAALAQGLVPSNAEGGSRGQ